MAGEGALQGLSLAVVETGGWCPIHTPTMEVQAVERGVARAEPAYQEAALGCSIWCYRLPSSLGPSRPTSCSLQVQRSWLISH